MGAAPFLDPDAQPFRPWRRSPRLDAAGIEALYREHARRLLIFFARRTLDAETATDLMAETFAVAFRDRRQFRGTSLQQTEAWLFGIARHLLARFYERGDIEREALRRISFERRELTDAEIERIVELAGIADLRRRVSEGVRELATADQQILRLRVVDEHDYDEIASELAVSEQTARARVSRALRRLRELVDEEEADANVQAAGGSPVSR